MGFVLNKYGIIVAMKRKSQNFKEKTRKFVNDIFNLYDSLNHELIINDLAVNCDKVLVRNISLDNDINFYFGFFNAISKYRELLKNTVIPKIQEIIDGNEGDGFHIESRLKNINSLSSKIYNYIHEKKEKGDVPINKCINDLFGLRTIVSLSNISVIAKVLSELKKEEKWKCKIIDSSKSKKKLGNKFQYRAVHCYIYNNSKTLRWEIQFWCKKHDKANRLSHQKYKQGYTSWEKDLIHEQDLYEMVR